jgi:hypothetical protein
MIHIVFSFENGEYKDGGWRGYEFAQSPPINPIFQNTDISKAMWDVIKKCIVANPDMLKQHITSGEATYIFIFALYKLQIHELYTEFTRIVKKFRIEYSEMIERTPKYASLMNSIKIAQSPPTAPVVSVAPSLIPRHINKGLKNDIRKMFLTRRKSDEPKKNPKMTSVPKNRSPNDRLYSSGYLDKPLFEPLPEILKPK